VLTVDLDRFKIINDLLGASVGDALLRVVADRVRSVIGPGDIPACFGGDEFAILSREGQNLFDHVGEATAFEAKRMEASASLRPCALSTSKKKCAPLKSAPVQ
jgi:diguanylate cyclase (GGDEF)-like protein